MEQHVDIFMYILCIEGDSHQIIEEDSDEDVELHACSGQGSSGQGHNDPFSLYLLQSSVQHIFTGKYFILQV
ncbi:hypothetical protein EB796_022349 [Bugula neritina]|uniref:Uncharacterized protein n=1 Tax=Bugula neritina TaxID=10212 RepID=A0A7J7IZK8_BUGNE|nr:hypothetical protein EB796_022349 [Bugula neritina]